MTSIATCCPVCSGESRPIRAWGGQGFHCINTIAGIQVDSTRNPFSLLACQRCAFIFKTPRLDDQQLLNLYGQSVDRAHEADISLIRDAHLQGTSVDKLCEAVASKYACGRRVLEIGCSNGRMLSGWGADWHKCGVEPSDAAAKIAEQRGIKIIAKTIDALVGKTDEKWDCILSVDTIEHVSDPVRFLFLSRRLLAPGGVIIILTGNMSCWLARFAGPRYWYASFPEHISFPTPTTFKYIAKTLGGTVLLSKSYRWGRHRGSFAVTWAIHLLKYTVFAILLTVKHLVGTSLPQRSFPVMTSHRDHTITVLGHFG